MPNYANGKIYKLVCTLPNIDDIYVGGTAKVRLYSRMSSHRYGKGFQMGFQTIQIHERAWS